MAASYVPLSLLSKGVGQVSKNGHERLDVYLEPEDYYNLDSKYQYQIAQFHRQAARSDNGSNEKDHSVPLHKTFLTRKGALLLFAEELAYKNNEEEEVSLVKKDSSWEQELSFPVKDEEVKEEQAIKTCHDLSWAILNYGRQRPTYRRKGDDLYFRFLYEPKGAFAERRIRPGFSPKRYISTWSKQWNEPMLQKLRNNGLISDKTLYRQNPLLPHLYKNATYNLSSMPPPYRVTKSMLLAPGNVPSYEFYRVRGPGGPGSVESFDTNNRVPPPSQQDDPNGTLIPAHRIQAVKYHESGEIMEVTYADLKPQEKQEILAELLVAAHEHQKHIRDTLDLVMTKSKRHVESERGGSSSGASELMVDMQRAILSLVESPVRQQMRERQKILKEQEEKLQEQKRKQQEKEERRQKRRQKRLEKEAEKMKKISKLPAPEPVKATLVEQPTPLKTEVTKKVEPAVEEVKEAKVDPKEEEKRLKEERKRKRREEREMRRKLREEKIQAEEKKKAEEASALAAKEKQKAERPPARDEPRHSPEVVDEDKKHHKHRHHHRHKHQHEEQEVTEAAPKPEDKKRRHRHEKHEHRHRHGEVQQGSNEPGSSQLQASDKKPAVMETNISVYEDGTNPRDTYVIIQKPQPGTVTEIQHVSKEKHRKLLRRDANLAGSGSIQVPNNTPAVDSRLMAQKQPQPNGKIEYEDVYVVKRISGSHRSSATEVDAALAAAASGAYVINPAAEVMLPEQTHPRGPKSAASSHSSGAKQILFAPQLPGDDETSSQKQNSCFYGGAMPITSNLVKQTLSDKMSILSVSQGPSEAASVQSESKKSLSASYHSSKHKQQTSSVKKSRRGSEGKTLDRPTVPSIGIEPATPMLSKQQESTTPQQQPSRSGSQYLAPSGSLPGSQHASLKGKVRSEGGGGSEQDGSDGDQQDSYDDDNGYQKRQPPSRKDSDNEDSDRSDEASSKSTERKSSKREFASKSSQTGSSKSKQASKRSKLSSSKDSHIEVGSEIEAPVYGLKGYSGPGSQSSASFLKSTSSKKSKSTRGSLPASMRNRRTLAASLKMPDGEVIPVGGSIARSSDKEMSETEDDGSASQTTKTSTHEKKSKSPEPTVSKPSLKLVASEQSSLSVPESSVKQPRRVSFAEVDSSKQATMTSEDEDYDEEDDKESQVPEVIISKREEPVESQEEDSSEYISETEEEATSSDVKEKVTSQSNTVSGDSRPLSSRSEKLTAHAQKVAALVVKKQRPKSGLEEDASDAAALWNEVIEDEKTEYQSEEDEGETEEETSDETEATTTRVGDDAESKDDRRSEGKEDDVKKQERLKKIITEKRREEKVIVAKPTTTKKELSVPESAESASSVPSSISSVQEEFVAKIQEKASDLGIEATDLEFEGDVVDKLGRSDIHPDEVEVVHDKEGGRHIVRSRRSSTTASSVLTPTSNETQKESPRQTKTVKTEIPKPAPSESAPKQKLVVDLPPAAKSMSPSRASSVTTSLSSTSSRSPISRGSSVSPERRRPSIPSDTEEVKLDFDVTTYERKLGDPKQEEPTLQARTHVEPEKIKAPADKKAGGEPTKGKVAAMKQQANTVAESVKSDRSSVKPPSKAKAGSKVKQPAAPTKGPQRKGKAGAKAADKLGAQDEGSIVGSEHTEGQKSVRDAAKPAAERGGKKGDAKMKKGDKAKPKVAETASVEREAVQSSPEKPPAKTPETPFLAGRPKEKKVPEEPRVMTSPPVERAESVVSAAKSKKSEKGKKKKQDTTQAETKVRDVTAPKPAGEEIKPVVVDKRDSPDKLEKTSKVKPKSAVSEKKESEEEEEDFDDLPPLPAETPEDEYDFVRVEDTPVEEVPKSPTPPPPAEVAPEPGRADDDKSQISDITAGTEGTEISSQAAAQNAEDEAEREAKLAAKQEREQKRAAAAERRKQEVERKRKEKEEQIRKEKEEQERQEQMKEELEAERRRREEATRMKKEEAERAKLREKEEEELRQKRILQQQEREKKQQEEYRRKMEEVQKRKREEEERKRLLALEKAKEEEERRKQEQEMLAEMEESERLLYEQRKKEEEEERRIREEERRKREEEEARIAMEQARIQALIKAKQQAELEEKLRFVKEFLLEANGMDQTQNVNRAFTFSYFELMQMLGLDVPVE